MFVKDDVKQQEIKELVAISLTFYNKYLQNSKYNVKQVCIFYLILLGIPFNLILSIKSRGSGFFSLIDKICSTKDANL